MSTTHRPALDQARLRALRDLAGDDMPDLPREVAELFIDTAANDLRELAAAVREGSAETVSQLAHRLRGSSANVGASTFERLCERVEQGDPHPEDVAQLWEEFDRVTTALRGEFRMAA